jgi:TolB-like protein/tetratricopeptide (TPR) repeat protein
MPSPPLLQRLKERKLVQWALAYLAGAFVVFQGVEVMAEPWGLSPAFQRGVHIVLLLGLLVTLVLAWYHGEKGRQRVSGPELLMVASLLVMAGVALAMLSSGEESPRAVEAPGPVETDDFRPSIAVLPLDDNSPDPQDAYIATGIHDKIISALGQISSLSVRARSSVDQYRSGPDRDARPPVREIATVLGVDFLLEGTAEVVGSAVRVAVRLIDGRLDEVLWEEDWQAEYLPAEAIRIQIDIAEGVASGLRVAIAPEEELRIASVPTNDPVAYRLVDRAGYLWSQRTEPEVREAIRLYHQAIERDSLYAEAYAGLASAYLILGDWGAAYGDDWGTRAVSFRRAQDMAERALDLDPALSLPHGVIAWAKMALDWDWDGAEREYLAGLEQDPEQSQIHGWYSGFLAGMGRSEEALRELATVQRLDPLSPWLANGSVVVYYLARQYDRAIEAGIETVALYPDMISPHEWLCESYLASGRIDEGMDACSEASKHDPPGRARMAVVSALRGEREAALKEIEEALATHGDRARINWDAAIVHAVFGDLDEAFSRLRRHFTLNRNEAWFVPADPMLDPFRTDPRWEEILRYIGYEH